MAQTSIVATPLPAGTAWRAVGRCIATSAVLLLRGRHHLPRGQVGLMVDFADGSRSRVYRETTLTRDPAMHPCLLVVGFRLRGVRGRMHALFRAESLLNTPLFVGFPGFVSKLWMAHDGNGRYRGIYEWDGPRAAADYAGALWHVLALVSVPGSIDYRVLPAARRADLLAGRVPGPSEGAWWLPTGAS